MDESAPRPVIVQTNCGGEAEARAIALAAIEARLAACANIQGPITAIYRWQGGIEEGTEWVLHLKTVVPRVPALEALIRERHGYELPCILILPIEGGEQRYVDWLVAESGG